MTKAPPIRQMALGSIGRTFLGKISARLLRCGAFVFWNHSVHRLGRMNQQAFYDEPINSRLCLPCSWRITQTIIATPASHRGFAIDGNKRFVELTPRNRRSFVCRPDTLKPSYLYLKWPIPLPGCSTWGTGGPSVQK